MSKKGILTSLDERKALIIGCGFAGSAFAPFLKRVGVAAEIYEARSASDMDAGAFLYLAPNGMNVLKLLGLEEDGLPTSGSAF